jgi:hypothetical protein
MESKSKELKSAVSVEIIQGKIYLIRGRKVMFDKDLAELYGVETGHLNRAVKRNIERFPNDFMYQLTAGEFNSLRCQFGILKRGQHFKYLPYVFTEQGVAMLSSVLKSKGAVQVNIQIMRVFTQLRVMMMLTHKDLARKIEELEQRFQDKFQHHDKQIIMIFDTIRQLLHEKDEAAKKKEPIGFHVRPSKESTQSKKYTIKAR